MNSRVCHTVGMWTMRPWMELTPDDVQAWNEIIAYRLSLDVDIPLAQRLCWGEAISSLGIPVYLVYHLEKKIGGLLFAADESLECVNGPLIHWHEPLQAQQELMEFVFHARSCAGELELERVVLHPRWLKNDELTHLSHLLTQPEEIHYAATLLVPIQDSEATQLSHYKSRLKRSLSQNQKENPAIKIVPLTNQNISDLVQNLSVSVRESVYLPPLSWFQALVSARLSRDVDWVWVSSTVGHTETHLMIGFTSSVAYFLFGGDKRSVETSSKISTARLAHHAAINACRARGITYYDFNGFKENVTSSDAYHSVNQFKSDWGGQIISYSAPRFGF